MFIKVAICKIDESTNQTLLIQGRNKEQKSEGVHTFELNKEGKF